MAKRILNEFMDTSFPSEQRDAVKRALKLIAQANLELAGVKHAYRPGDPLVADLGEMILHGDMALEIGGSWLQAHPARSGRR